MSRGKLRTLVEGALMVALGLVLSFVKVYTLPNGGSITLGSMIPVLIFSLRHGAPAGLLAGVAHGLLQLIVEPYFVHPAQVILDYPLAFGLLGLAGLLQTRPFAGVALGIAGRFVSHYLSGVIFFAQYAPENMSPYLYSAVYNGSYLLPELIISGLVISYGLRSFARPQTVREAHREG